MVSYWLIAEEVKRRERLIVAQLVKGNHGGSGTWWALKVGQEEVHLEDAQCYLISLMSSITSICEC